MIAFVHEGPSTVSHHFDEARVTGALQHFQLVFVGSAGRQTMLEKRALAMPDVRLRTHVLFNYLAIRHALHHPVDVSPPDASVISRCVRHAENSIVATARHVADDTAEVYAQSSDIANVRDTASSDIRLERETPAAAADTSQDKELAILLDPIGVFARNHDATAGDLFSSIADFVSRADDICAEEPESDAPAASASVPTTPPQAPQDNVPRKRKCGRAAAPMNEFTHGTALLYGAFWYLFPLGSQFIIQ